MSPYRPLTSSFKAYLTQEDGTSSKPEVRRFGIEIEFITDFQHVKEKLETTFPSIRGKKFNVYWRDSDDDKVTISSDEELEIALNETKGQDLRVLYLTLLSDSQQQRTKASTAEPAVCHPHVICDGCDKGVYGFRYKCIQCPDFDLCMDCEAQSVHPEHCMLRISIPTQLKTHYTRRLARHVNRLRKAQSFNVPSENPKESTYKSTRCEPRSRNFSENPSWIDVAAAYVKEWTDNSNVKCPMTETQKPQQYQVPPQAEPKTAESKAHSRKPSDSHVEFLKNIGEHIAQFLDPLGIDVNVLEKDDKAQNTTAGTKTSIFESNCAAASDFTSVSTSTSTLKTAEPIVTVMSNNRNIQEEKFPERESVKKAEDNVPSNASAVFNSSNESEANVTDFVQFPLQTNPETEGWTLLNENDSPLYSSPNTSRAVSVTSVHPLHHSEQASETFQKSSVIHPQKPLYPPLPQEETFPRTAEITHPFFHSDPKIQRAMETMTEMGFSNNDGWLTQLIVSKDGDITKILDILEPIRH